MENNSIAGMEFGMILNKTSIEMNQLFHNQFWLICIILSLIVGSCKSKTRSKEDCEIINLLQSGEVLSLDDYIESIETIILEPDPVRIVYPKKMLISDNRLFVLASGQVYSFDDSGLFKNYVGRKGNGPDEYLFILDCCISLDKQTILCLDNKNTVYRYSIKDGRFVDKIATMEKGTSSVVIPMKDDGFGLFFANPPDNQINDYENKFYCLKLYNKKGDLQGEQLLREDYNILMSFRSQAVQESGNEYVLSYLPGDGICYRCDDGEINPLYYLSFDGKGLPIGFTKQSQDPFLMIGDIFESEYYKNPSSVCQTSSLLFCSAFGAHSAYINFLFNKVTDRGIRWQSYGNEAPPMSALCADDDFFYFTFEESSLSIDSPDAIPDPLIRTLVTKFGVSKGEDDNPLVIKVKFKIP